MFGFLMNNNNNIFINLFIYNGDKQKIEIRIGNKI